MKKISLLFVLALACHSPKKVGSSESGDSRTQKIVMYNSNTYLLTETTVDSTYGFTASNPVKVGGVKKNEGPLNERRYLNGLLGPKGEVLKYFRAGSCCAFESKNGFMGTGLLDKYRVFWKGSDTFDVYINMYDEGNLYIPVGFTGIKKD